MVADLKTIGSKVEDETYNLFRLVCERDGVTVSDRVKDLINKFVNEEAPFIVLEQDLAERLKAIAEKEGISWREMTCGIILQFCEKCSQKAKREKAQTEEAHSEPTSIEEKLKTFRIIRE